MSNLSITLQYVFEQIYFQTNPQKLQNITIWDRKIEKQLIPHLV
jgi:hypothetical protein